MVDSLVLAEQIELMGGIAGSTGGIQSTISECAGVVFKLAPGYDLNEPQPTSDYVASLVLDGEAPVGRRASNRTITLPIVVFYPAAAFSTATRTLLISAREVLQRICDQPWFTLRWTRDGGLPLVFDGFRAQASKPTYSTQQEKQGSLSIQLTFSALPYGRSETPETVNFQAPLSGVSFPPFPVLLDDFSSVSGTGWSASSIVPSGVGSQSAYWNPSSFDDPQGLNSASTYSRTGIGPFNLVSGGWAASLQGSGSTTLAVINNNVTSSIDLGDQFVLLGNFLTGDETGFEGGTTGNWTTTAPTGAPASNCTIANSTAQARTGTHSMAITATATGDVYVYGASSTAQMMQINPYDIVAVDCYLRAAATVRTGYVGAAFFDLNGNWLTTQFGVGSGTADTTTSWTQELAAYGSQAPTSALYCCPVIRIAACAAGEVHYVDDVLLTGRSAASIGSTIYTVVGIQPPFIGFGEVQVSPAMPAGVTNIGYTLLQCGPPDAQALTLWTGLGSTAYYDNFCRRGGAAHFRLTLTDSNSNTVSSSRINARLYGSASDVAPKWTKIRIPLANKAGFNYASVTGYTLTVTNRSGASLSWTQHYVAMLQAEAPTRQLIVPFRGVVYDLQGIVGSARTAPRFTFQQAGAPVSHTASFTVPGVYYWYAPYGVSTLTNVLAIGGGGASAFQVNGTGGGSGGSSGFATNVGVTPFTAYQIIVGSGGRNSGSGFRGLLPTPPSGSQFTGDSVTVTAPGGNNAPTGGSSSGAIANAAGTPSGFAGGPGGNGVATTTGGGGGGGGSGGTASAGNPGGAASGSTGGAAATAVTGGYPGGAGGSYSGGTGHFGNEPAGYGGGTGGDSGSIGNQSVGAGSPGQDGIVQLTYPAQPQFKTLLVHRPGFFQPDEFNPLVPLQSGDPLNGTLQYVVPPLVSGVNARFNGTYSVVIVNSAWNNPTASRTVTVTVTLWEEPGGNQYTQSVAWTFVPNNLPNNTPFVVLGNLTIPLNEIPPDNLAAWYEVAITDTNAADTFTDVIFLDTQGSTVIIANSNEYNAMYIDEPTSSRDIGMIMGTQVDRSAAVSMLSAAQIISGGPLDVDPYGNQSLLAYCVEGAPNMQMQYYPRWFSDRLA